MTRMIAGTQGDGSPIKKIRMLDLFSGIGGFSLAASWRENWLEAAARLCVVDDGLSRGLVRPARWREDALRGAGNAIVPYVAVAFFQAIKEVEQ